MENKTIQVQIYGKVQGVFFRQHTLEKARMLNLAGWVRNRPDGSVEAVFTGLPSAINEILTWCRQGSPASSVTHVEVAEIALRKFPGFIIKR